MPEVHWTDTNTGWPEAGKPYIEAAEAAYDKGEHDGSAKALPVYIAPAGWSSDDKDRLTFVYASAWNANSILGSAAKTKDEADKANDRKRAYRVETGRAITKGLIDGFSSLMAQYQPLDTWYDGKSISYLNALKETYQDAYTKGQSLSETLAKSEEKSSPWTTVGLVALGAAAIVGAAVLFSGGGSKRNPAQAATYTKLRDGSWGLRGSGLASGRIVSVTKRDGTVKTETVGRVLWTGSDGTCLATIQQSSAGQRTSGARRGGRYECEECGEYVTPGTRCWETGATH